MIHTSRCSGESALYWAAASLWTVPPTLPAALVRSPEKIVHAVVEPGLGGDKAVFFSSVTRSRLAFCAFASFCLSVRTFRAGFFAFGFLALALVFRFGLAFVVFFAAVFLGLVAVFFAGVAGLVALGLRAIGVPVCCFGRLAGFVARHRNCPDVAFRLLKRLRAF